MMTSFDMTRPKTKDINKQIMELKAKRKLTEEDKGLLIKLYQVLAVRRSNHENSDN